MIDTNLYVKIDEFNGCMEQMAQALVGKTTKRDIIRSEVQTILQKTVSNVRVSTEANIRRSQETRPWTTFNGKRYLIYGSGKQGHRNRYPDSLWGEIQTMREKDIRTRIAAIGWGQRAWLEIANAIGLTINAGKGETATEPGRDAKSYVRALEQATDDSYTISVTNSQRLQNWIGGRTAFFGAIASRVTYFRQNLAHGVFNDLKAVASKYKGIEIRSD